MQTSLTLPITAALATLLTGSAAHALEETAIDVDVTYNHSCAVTSCGDVLCWGRDDYGQSEDKLVTEGIYVNPPPKFDRVTTGYFHTCARNEDLLAQCWGHDGYGQSTPPFYNGVLQIEAGGYHTCMLDMMGAPYCFGYGVQGQTSPPAEFFVDISAGAFHSCGVRPGGEVLCWGDDTYGQSFGHVPVPTWRLLPGERFEDVEAGNYHTCALTNQDRVYCWGRDNTGQLFIPDPPWEYAEVGPNMYRASIDPFDVLAAGPSGNCAIDGGTVTCWGAPMSSGGTYAPPAVADDIAVGAAHGCFIDGSGGLQCWGNNAYDRANPPPIGGTCPNVFVPFPWPWWP